MKTTFALVALAGLSLSSGFWTSGLMAADGGFHYDEQSVRPATYYAAYSNLMNVSMFSGLGEKLVFSPYERDSWLRRVGFITRPPMPDVALIGAVYASTIPDIKGNDDLSNPVSLRWPIEGADLTLDPGAQAWTLLKITSPQFNLQFRDLRENKIAALMMIPQARELAKILDNRLDNGGLFAPRDANGTFASPDAMDQAAVLWASSSLIAAALGSDDNYWQNSYANLTDPDDARSLADKAFAALTAFPARTASARAISIVALAHYAAVVNDTKQKADALELARQHADAIGNEPGDTLSNISLAIYGLVEATRLFNDEGYAKTAADLFRNDLLGLWDEDLGVFAETDNTTIYSPEVAGAVVAALNAIRWFGPDDLTEEASRLYPVFFENAIVRSGLLQASPLALVSSNYLENQPAETFAHPALPDPAGAGVAPVFAAEVTYENGDWTVTDPAFETGPAMFLSNMLALRNDGQADIFLTNDQLNSIR